MLCRDATERFSDYLDGFLSDEGRRALTQHLAACPWCREGWERFRSTVSLVGSLREVEVPQGFAAKVLEKTQRRPWKRLLKTLFFPLHVKLPLEAFALLLIAFGAVLLYRGSPILQKEIQAPSPPQVQAPRPGSGQAPPEARPQTEPPAPLKREQKAKDKAPAPAPSEAPAQPRSEVAQESAPLAKAAPPLGLAAKRALEPSLDAVLVLRVEDVPLAAAGLKAREARFGGREADEGRKLKEEIRETKEEMSFDIVLPRGAYPAFKASLPELGELSIEQEALEGGPLRETITVRVTILPSTR